MADEDIFYDSLEEDACQSNDAPSAVEDLDTAVPLYCGETSISQLTPSTKKRIEKPQKPVLQPTRPKKSYLAMYYEKKGMLEAKKQTGSNTSRAVCEKLSPRRDLELEADLKEVVECRNESDSEHEELYENFMNLELENKQASSTMALVNDKKSKLSSRSSLLPKACSERSFYVNFSKNDAIEKLELLKKRQNYGTKMSMTNRIKIEELKKLKKIKQCKVDKL